jgi:hypothetical protein
MLLFETPVTRSVNCARIRRMQIFAVEDISAPALAAPVIQIHIEKGFAADGRFEPREEIVLNIGAPDSTALLEGYEAIRKSVLRHLQTQGFLPHGSITD